jgi:hypothetical protein
MNTNEARQMWVMHRFTTCFDDDTPPVWYTRTLFSWQAVLGHFIFGTLRMMTRYCRYPGVWPYGDLHRRNYFHLVSSESTVCNVISAQSIRRLVRQYICLVDKFPGPTCFRRGSVVSLHTYLTDRLTTYFRRGFNFRSRIVIVLLNRT